MDKVVSHKCPHCGSALNFSIDDGKLKCTSCASLYTEAEMEKYSKQLDKVAKEVIADGDEEMAELLAMEAEEAGASNSIAAGASATIAAAKKDNVEDVYKDDEGPIEEKREGEISWGATSNEMMDTEEMNSYKCESCGGTIIAEGSLAATKCPYCENPAIIPGKLGGMLKPDLIIPFAIKKDEMRTRMAAFLKKKFLVPKDFRSTTRIDSTSGIYVPFWFFDAKIYASITYDAETRHSYRSGDYQVTETRHYICEREGNIDFEKIPADASEAMKDEYMDAIEPFDYDGLKAFDPMYLAGFLADKYTVTREECKPRVLDRIHTTCQDEFGKTVKGYSSKSVMRSNVMNREEGKVIYAMLPVWLMTMKYKNKMYEFVMNGQTGKFVGDLPISFGRCAAMWAILSVIFILIGMGISALF